MKQIKEIAQDFASHGITAYYVGGFVRDAIMGITSDDIDVCLVGVKDKSIVEEIVNNFGTITQEVGKQFPNWIATIDGNKVDFALARAEKLVGLTRQDFNMTVDGVTIEQDLLRRDFTMNAIAINILTEETIDPYNGKKHIEMELVHPVSEAFKEDSLRVYRAARFIARFKFTPSHKLLQYCENIVPTDLSNERVGIELMKMFKQAKKPSFFFVFLRSIKWLGYHFEELEDLINIPQSPEHHPEGSAYDHTLHCIDAPTDWFTRACMLCHDLGKATTTTISPEGKIRSIGHELASVPLTKKLLTRIKFASNDVIHQICTLVELHMLRIQFRENNHEKVIRQTLRRLMSHNLEYYQLVDVIHADLAGRPPKPFPAYEELQTELGVGLACILINDMAPIVTGKLLIAEGIEPSPRMGEMVAKALELQDRTSLNRLNWKERLRGAGFKEIKLIK